jgi:hypothetical protein
MTRLKRTADTIFGAVAAIPFVIWLVVDECRRRWGK